MRPAALSPRDEVARVTSCGNWADLDIEAVRVIIEHAGNGFARHPFECPAPDPRGRPGVARLSDFGSRVDLAVCRAKDKSEKLGVNAHVLVD